jgi:uncharacterized GH25 family protein
LLLLLLLICAIIYLISHRHPQQSEQISDLSSAPPSEVPVSEAVVPEKAAGPTYVSVNTKQRPKRLSIENQIPECLLTGKVVSAAGIPLPGATVAVHASGPDDSTLKPLWPDPILTGVCDSEGRYSMRLLESVAGAFVAVHKPGYAEVRDRRDFLVPGEYAKNYTLREACACIEGAVIDDGKPVVSARVDVTFVRGDDYIVTAISVTTRVSTLTDAMGRFKIEGLIEGHAGLDTLVPGYQRKSTTFDTTAGPCGIVILKLERGQTISLAVKNTQGFSIPAASAICTLEDRNSRLVGTDEYGTEIWTPRPRGQANKSGIIEILVPPTWDYCYCRIDAPKYQTALITIDPKSPPHEVTLQDAVLFMGVVLSGSGDPVPGAQVMVYEEESLAPLVSPKTKMPVNIKNSQAVSTVANMRGTFELNLPFSIAKRVRVTKKGFRETRVALNVEKPVRFIEVRLESQEAGFFGRVVDSEGKAIPRYRIVIRASGEAGISYSRDVEDGEGRFLVTDVPAGTYLVAIAPVQSNMIEIAKPQDITLKSGFLYGEITFQSMRIETPKK